MTKLENIQWIQIVFQTKAGYAVNVNNLKKHACVCVQANAFIMWAVANTQQDSRKISFGNCVE